MNKFFLTVCLFLTIHFCTSAQTKNFIDQSYIEVSGIADTLITPNKIFIKIILSEKDSRDKTSVEEQENKMVTAFKTLNINVDSNLTTSDMLSNYKFYLLKKKDILKSKEYILKVSDAVIASKVFILLEDLDISNVSIFKVDHTDIENIKSSCRTNAILNAKAKAISLTKPLGQFVGNAIHILDNEANLDNQIQWRASGIRGNSTVGYTKYEPAKIDFEKMYIVVSINVKFILK